MFRKDRNTAGGGLVIYTRDGIPCDQRQDLENESIESICKFETIYYISLL